MSGINPEVLRLLSRLEAEADRNPNAVIRLHVCRGFGIGLWAPRPGQYNWWWREEDPTVEIPDPDEECPMHFAARSDLVLLLTQIVPPDATAELAKLKVKA